MRQISFLLRSFLCQDVTLKGMLSFDLSRTSEFESLLRTGSGFHFWHLTVVYL
jgi:hypothetical protein